MKLYRPVGLYEMEKILEKAGKEFPVRFSEQPIFYPVLNVCYARQIAEKWNQKDFNSGFVGFITEFDIDDNYIESHEVHCVGGKEHLEYWIPAEELQEFNKKMKNKITIIEAYYGNQYIGIKPTGISGFKEEGINNQIDTLKSLMSYNPMDFSGTVFVEWKLINLNFLYWKQKMKYNEKIMEEIYFCLKRNSKLFIDINEDSISMKNSTEKS
ncbi:MAG: hypothetical protein LBV03_05640 [Fusobacteriales bacterium]|jgi:hypothetical protein|nr:hypothetical protein [Fusobacteriales bacterium]